MQIPMTHKGDKPGSAKLELREAFWRFYTVKPISKISVKDICTLAGYNRGTFYRYYRDVYEVLESIENEILEQFSKRFAQIARCSRKMDIAGLVKYTLAPCSVYNKYLAVMLGENGDPAFQKKLRESTKDLLRSQIALKYQELDAAGEFALEFCVSGILSCTRMWYEQDSGMDINQFITIMLALLEEPMELLHLENRD